MLVIIFRLPFAERPVEKTAAEPEEMLSTVREQSWVHSSFCVLLEM